MITLPIARSGKSALEVAILAAKEAGDILANRFQIEKEVRYKGKGNLVTEIDLLAEKAIIEVLKGEYFDHKILSEETNNTTNTSGYTWIVDPLDGTNNYVYGIPFFAPTLLYLWQER
jgi:myo-inositol-1(or 4)-monophosphatase